MCNRRRLRTPGLLRSVTLLSLALLVATPAWSGGAGIGPGPEASEAWNRTDRIIVKFRDGAGTPKNAALPAATVQALGTRAGARLTHVRPMSGDAHVLALPGRMPDEAVRAITDRLMADPAVEYAEPDSIARPLAAPNDPDYASQWHYQASAGEPGAANLPGAWDITTGSAGVVVAVIDTGLLPHADIDSNILDGSGRVVPGYDFVSNALTGNDGDGRDADPSDPGDWITSAESTTVGGQFEYCPVDDSSWHGTHVAGTIGALSNNSLGVAGINWTSRILPARVLGKCGGYVSDIADAIRWSAGLSVSGVPDNANPARVLNLSLGGSGGCSTTYQSAIDAATAAGAVVVVAAGNSNINAINAPPGNCNNVITVAAVGRAGQRAYYSNYGAVVEIAAPGGDQSISATNGVYSTLNAGTTTPGADSYAWYQGTSMATPHVAGIVSLMLSVDPTLSPAEVLSKLQATARPFPTGTGLDCTTSLCGAGIIDAANAVADCVARPAGAIHFTSTTSSVAEGAGNAMISVARTGGSAGTVGVTYATSAGTATSGVDYTAVAGNLAWLDGDASNKTIVVPIAPDALFEAGETFTVSLSGPTGGAVLGFAANQTVTITNDDVDDFPPGGSLPGDWTQPIGSSAPWSVASDQVYSGTNSLKSGAITDDQMSSLAYTAEFTAGHVSFAYRVSSEVDFDYLRFYIDGIPQGEWSGESGWSEASFPIDAGVHELKWQYEKDGSVSEGSDAAWIDSVLLPLASAPIDGACGSAQGVLTATAPSQANLCAAGMPSSVAAGPASYTWTCDGANGGANASCSAPRGYTVSATAGANGSVSPASQVVAYGGRATVTVTPNPDYSTSATGCGGALTGLTSYTTGPVTANCTVTAAFAVTNDNFPPGPSLPTGYASPAGSNAAWTVDSTAAFAGASSLKSGAIGHSQRSDLQYTGQLTAGTISFYVRTSSQAGGDYLEFYVDGVKKQSWSGETAWTKASFPVTSGHHTLLWRYVKNASVAGGSDAAWIDAVRLPVVVADLSWILLLLD
jgi:serine protease